MSPNNNKLELTWVGKYDEQKPVEPRILIENPKYSYGTVETGVLPNGKPWNGLYNDIYIFLRIFMGR